jgi:arylamine N-acetyltransferase
VVFNELNGKYMLNQRKKRRWRTRYLFDLKPRKLEDFKKTYQWLTNNPNGHTTNVMFRKHLKNGFLSLYNDQLTIIEDGVVRRVHIPEYHAISSLFINKEGKSC